MATCTPSSGSSSHPAYAESALGSIVGRLASGQPLSVATLGFSPLDRPAEPREVFALAAQPVNDGRVRRDLLGNATLASNHDARR